MIKKKKYRDYKNLPPKYTTNVNIFIFHFIYIANFMISACYTWYLLRFSNFSLVTHPH